MIGQRTTLVSLSISVWRYHLDGDFLHARRDGTPDVMVWNLLDRQAGLRGQVTKTFQTKSYNAAWPMKRPLAIPGYPDTFESQWRFDAGPCRCVAMIGTVKYWNAERGYGALSPVRMEERTSSAT
jgi:hypothetical protein